MNTKLFQLQTGITIEYSLSGTSNPSNLVFVHGLGPNLRQFKPQEAFFSPHFRVVLVSLRGHGGSSMSEHASKEDFTVERLAADVKALLLELDIHRIHFVGNSLGGLVGYQLLKTDQELISSLTTFGTTAELHTSKALVVFLTSLTRILGPKTLGKLASISTKDKAVARRMAEMFAAANKTAVWMTQHNISDYNYVPVLQDCDLPMLILKGHLDAEINAKLDSTLKVLHQNPNFRLSELEGAGHFSNMEKPELFNQILLDFLNGIDA
jgi:pimeloyl-ACP methyl ester carboxylesterase